MRKLKPFVYLLLFAFAAVVRLWRLDVSPPSVDFDEAALGYNAYSLLKTAKDEYGNFLPLSLRSFNDYKPALYSYLTTIPVALFGLNEVSTRLVSSIAGFVQVVLIFLLAREFVRGKLKGPIILTIVLAQPWLLHFSRTAFEANLGATFFLVGVWLLSREKVAPAAFSLAAAAYSYHSPRLAAPLLILLWGIDPLALLVDRHSTTIKTIAKKLLLPLGLFLLLAAPIIISSRDSLILKRYQQTNIFKVFSPFAPRELISTENPWFSLPANPAYFLAARIVGHAASYFSPINLGERAYHWVRNSPMYIPSFSMLGLIEATAFIPGVIAVIRKLNDKKIRLLLYWIIAGTAPAAVTWEWFHPLRSLNIFPAILIVSVIGLFSLWEIRPRAIKVAVASLYLLVLIPTIIYTIENELVYLVWANHGEYQPGGFKEGVPLLKEIQDRYDKVVIDTPHAQGYIFFLFYQKYPPEKIQSYASKRPTPLTEGDLSFNFDKYEFRKINWPEDRSLKRTVFWATPLINKEEVQRDGANITEIKNAVGGTATYLITKN